MIRLTKAGREEVKSILSERHKQDYFDASMIDSWCAEAEENGENGSCAPYFELKAWEACSGHTEHHEINGYEVFEDSEE